ncbi:hypothetical protein D3C80_1867670 [compost metagenome]
MAMYSEMTRRSKELEFFVRFEAKKKWRRDVVVGTRIDVKSHHLSRACYCCAHSCYQSMSVVEAVQEMQVDS